MMTFLSRTEHYLVVAGRKHRYKEMFKSLVPEDHTTLNDEVDNHIRWAMQHLKREDRIIWYLRKYKAQLEEHLDGEASPSEETEASEEWDELVDAEEDLKHYLANAEVHKMKPILDFVFPPSAKVEEILQALEKLETQALEKGTDRLLDVDSKMEPVIKFPDGWGWYLIDKESCEKEGKAMHHCGNTGDPKKGDQILSLREPVRLKTGEQKLKPHLTFILNEGVLGEMKGFANNKPDPKLHRYIVPLLESDYVLHVGGGGYAAHNNFSLDDLDQTTKEALLTKKPELGDINKLVDKHPKHPIIVQKAVEFYAKEFGVGFKKLDPEGPKLSVMITKSADGKSPLVNLLDHSSAFLNGRNAIIRLVQMKHLKDNPAFNGVPNNDIDDLIENEAEKLKGHETEKDLAEALGFKDFPEVVRAMMKQERKPYDPKQKISKKELGLHYLHSILREGVRKAAPDATITAIEKQVTDHLSKAFDFHIEEGNWYINVPFKTAVEHKMDPIRVSDNLQLDEKKFASYVTPEIKKLIQKLNRKND